IRNGWGNKAPGVSASEVARVRGAMDRQAGAATGTASH
ncbi:MAG: hypothetical protein QOF42_281, partial [Gammaproteobacteria bacterium]|nr:hypothetical protein [Gammaproteobacteria bacterium]